MPQFIAGVWGWAVGNLIGLVVGGYVMYRWPQIGTEVETIAVKVLGVFKRK